jgi:hypothetical protein
MVLVQLVRQVDHREFVEPPDVYIADEDLRYRAPAGPFDHLQCACLIRGDVDLLEVESPGAQQRFCVVAPEAVVG